MNKFDKLFDKILLESEKYFRVDRKEMEEVIIDKKVTNLVGVLEWDLADTKEKAGEEFFSFDDEPAKPTKFGHNGGPAWDDDEFADDDDD